MSSGGVVLVHGLWSNPDDWQWVRQGLASAGVLVRVPDLPSHRSGSAGLVADAEDVRAAIRSLSGPVVVVGWSYGGDVISVAAAAEASVRLLIYVAAVPEPAHGATDTQWIDHDPHVLLQHDNIFVLDNEWWLTEEAGRTFAASVVEHLRRHPRRAAAVKAVSVPQPAAAWADIPTTVLLGRNDALIPEHAVTWAVDHLSDGRLLDTDHFILFRHPDAICRVALEALRVG